MHSDYIRGYPGELIDEWRQLYLEHKVVLSVNRISGKELKDYFVGKYGSIAPPFHRKPFTILLISKLDDKSILKKEEPIYA